MSAPTIVTAGLPYANGPIHIGHLVEYIMTDVYVRALRMAGEDARYVCADDTHGTPIELSAQKAGVPPEVFVERYAKEHLEDFQAFGIRFDSYYSTNSEENRRWVNEIYDRLRGGGHLERRSLEQFFDETANRFLPDRFIRGTCPKCRAPDQYGDACERCGTTYQPTDLENPISVITGTRPVLRSSEHVFVGLARFTDMLRDWVASEGRLQPEIRNWVEGWIEGGLRDWCISRDAPYFGFEIPDMPGKFFYVWLDAPIGYISSTENWARRVVNEPELTDRVWRERAGRIVHVIGKDIVYFHTLFWPAMLHAAGLRVPDRVQVHGFLTVNGVKMSKSRGTFINASVFRQHLDPIYLRYYLASKTGPTVDDIDLVFDEFIDRTNADLVGKLVNLVARGAAFLATKLGGRYGGMPAEAEGHLRSVEEIAKAAVECYRRFDSAGAVRSAVEIARVGNKIFQDSEPWKLLKTEPERAREIVTLSLNIARASAVVLAPALPAFAAKVYPILGLSGQPVRFEEAWAFDLIHREAGTPDRVFDRIERSALDAIVEASKSPSEDKSKNKADENSAAMHSAEEGRTSETGNTSEAGKTHESGRPRGSEQPGQRGKSRAHGEHSAESAEGAEGNQGVLTIDAFGKVDLRVGLILKADTVEGADKLLRLTVDLGEPRPRTIFAGIRRAYEASALEGLRVAVVANLAPRKMRFGTSEGMVLAAGSGGADLWLLTVSDRAPPGSKIS